MVSREVVDLVCGRLRSLPYCYIYCAKMQGLSLRVAKIWLKPNKIMSGILCESLCGRVMKRLGVVYMPSGKVG